MSWKVGLGASHDDLDIQGEIDFSFFDVAGKSQPSGSEHINGEGSSVVPLDAGLSPPSTLGLTDHSNNEAIGNSSLNHCAAYRENDSQEAYYEPGTSYGGGANVGGGGHKVIEAIIPTLEVASSSRCHDEATDRDMKDPQHEKAAEDMGERVKSPTSSVSDSEGLSSLSEDSMEGLSESESITDVTPLHSPYMCDSPLPPGRLHPSKLARRELVSYCGNGLEQSDDSDSSSSSDSDAYENRTRRESVKFNGKVRLGRRESGNDTVDLQVLVEAIRQLESQQSQNSQKSRKLSPPSLPKGRKNMTFSNDEVRRIDKENQRLLKRILAQQNRPKPRFHPQPKGCHHLAPSAVNRQRQQRQIELDNLALLKKIESAKPSHDVASSRGLHEGKRSSTARSSRSQSSVHRSLIASSSSSSPSLTVGSHLPSASSSSSSSSHVTSSSRTGSRAGSKLSMHTKHYSH